MIDFQKQKSVVRKYIAEFDNAPTKDLIKVIKKYTTPDYHWRGMHPFHEQKGADAVVDVFWKPFRDAFSPVQRREDIFFAGANDCDEGKTQWVVSTGNFLGLFDKSWLGIPPTYKMTFLRYAEFHRITEGGKIAETTLFCDILSVMHQAGQYPLPPMTGSAFIYPGPRTHDGLLFTKQKPIETTKTKDLVMRMVNDLWELNKTGFDNPPPEYLTRTWHDDMIWYGPTGIGASYTIPRYQHQHQYPFRQNLKDKVSNGHIARCAEGNYLGFFGWPNLNNRNKGGFLGMPASDVHAPMKVVDIYRREGDKLAENWVYMDLLHYFYVQGLDVLARMRALNQIF